MKHLLLLTLLLAAPLAASAQTPALEVKNGNNDLVFQVNTDGAALARGFASGAIPATGAGRRMMWYPEKWSFRAGRVTGAEWDEGNMGAGSAAFGLSTTASGYGTLATGSGTMATGNYATALGVNSKATADYATALGVETTASGTAATAMGYETTASGKYATAMGSSTTASGYSSTAMGFETTAQSYASLVIGQYNTVSGLPQSWVGSDPLFVAGNGISSSARGNAFVLYKNGDITATGSHTIRFDGSGSRVQLHLIETTTNDYARLRFTVPGANWWDVAAGGSNNGEFNIYSNVRGNVISLRATGSPLVAYNGAYLSTGGTWTNSSDSTKKAGFAEMDADDVLARLASLPITRWHYKTDPEALHVGPMAQDFRAAFGLGSDETSIATVDADGVLMLAVQALEKRTRELEDQVAQLQMEKEVLAYGINNVGDTLAARIAELEARLAALTSTADKP